MDPNADTLLPDEEIAFFTRPHWMAMLPTAAASLGFMAAVLMMLLAGRVGPNLALMLKVFMLVLLGANMCQYWILQNTAILVTNRRVMVQRNMIVETATSEFLLAKAQTIEVRQPIIGAWLGYGNVTISGTGGATEIFSYVTNPAAMRAALQQQIEAATTASAPPQAPPGERHLGPVSSV